MSGFAWVLRALVLYVASVASTVIGSALITTHAGPFPPDGPVTSGPALLIVHAACIVVVLAIAARANVSGRALALLLFVALFLIQTAMLQIETVVFNHSIGIPLGDIAGFVSVSAFNALVVASLGAWFFRPPSGGPLPLPAGFAWQLGVATLAYVLVYFVAGYWIAWSHEAVRAYYNDGRQIDTLATAALQIVRGALWAFIAAFIAARLRGPAALRIAVMAIAFAALTSAQLLYPNSYMPWAVRFPHLIEVAVSMAAWGALAGWLFGPREDQRKL